MGITVVFFLAFFVGVGGVLMRWGGARISDPTDFFDYLVQSRWWLLGLLVSWVCGLGYALSLTRMNLAVAVSIYTGLGYVTAVLGSYFILHEPLSFRQIVGCFFVVVGLILLIGRSSV